MPIYRHAARWMMDEINRTGILKQEMAAVYIDNKYGRNCVELTEYGNPSINEKVRDEFKKLHQGKVGWDNARQAWYMRVQ